MLLKHNKICHYIVGGWFLLLQHQIWIRVGMYLHHCLQHMVTQKRCSEISLPCKPWDKQNPQTSEDNWLENHFDLLHHTLTRCMTHHWSLLRVCFFSRESLWPFSSLTMYRVHAVLLQLSVTKAQKRQEVSSGNVQCDFTETARMLHYRNKYRQVILSMTSCQKD